MTSNCFIILPLQEAVRKLLEDLNIYHENYFPILRCLHVFTSSLPKYPLGKQVKYSYSVSMRHILSFPSVTSELVFILFIYCPAVLPPTSPMETDAFLPWEERNSVWFLCWQGRQLVSQQECVCRRRQMYRSANELAS